MSKVIISRHPATIEFIARHLGGEYLPGLSVGLPGVVVVGKEQIPVITGNAAPTAVAGKEVYGNIPLDLAALATEVNAVLFTGAPPRGAEYGLAEMDAAGAYVGTFEVKMRMASQ